MDADSETSSLSTLIISQFTSSPVDETGWGALNTAILLLIWLIIVIVAGYSKSLLRLNGATSENLKERSDSASKRLLNLIEEKSEFHIASVTLLSFLQVSFAILLFQALWNTSVVRELSSVFTLLAIILIISVLSLLGNQVLPKIVATQYPLSFCRNASFPAYLLHRVSSPLTGPISTWFQSKTGYALLGLPYLSSEDLKAMADIGEAQGTIEEEERELIHSIVDFRDTDVKEVMVNRMDMDAIPTTATLSDALELIQSSGHSRLPLYEKHLDNVVGIVYAKDLLPYLTANNGRAKPDWQSVARPPFFVPASKPLDELLKDFQSRKKHLAIVLDDYGGTAGLVTMEDVLEEIVGDIRDEFDEAEEDLHQQVSEFTHLFDARIHLDDLQELLEINLDTEDFDFDTLGGLIFHLKGDIPVEGDEVVFGSMKMRIESIENHRIGHVMIQVHPPTKDITPVL